MPGFDQVPHGDLDAVKAKIANARVLVLELKEIADIVDLSPRTVEAIRDKLKTKTGAKSMAGLVMYAVKTGIITK